jgi:hypothetical protein
MKVRVLFVASTERYLLSGEIYDLPEADAAQLLASGDGEGVDKKVPALADPRPASDARAAEEAAV